MICIFIISSIRVNFAGSLSAILLVDIAERDNDTIVQVLSDFLLVSRKSQLERHHIFATDKVGKVWIHVLKEHTLLAFAEGKTSWHAVDNPRAGLDYSALGNRQVDVHLVD